MEKTSLKKRILKGTLTFLILLAFLVGFIVFDLSFRLFSLKYPTLALIVAITVVVSILGFIGYCVYKTIGEFQ